MKKVFLILPIRGPRSPTEQHAAGETITVTDQEARNIVNCKAGVILESLPEPEVRINADTTRGQSVLRDPSKQNSMGSGGRTNKDSALDDSGRRNKQLTAKVNNQSRKKK